MLHFLVTQKEPTSSDYNEIPTQILYSFKVKVQYFVFSFFEIFKIIVIFYLEALCLINLHDSLLCKFPHTPSVSVEPTQDVSVGFAPPL